jgi:hypothetical protein
MVGVRPKHDSLCGPFGASAPPLRVTLFLRVRDVVVLALLSCDCVISALQSV